MKYILHLTKIIWPIIKQKILNIYSINSNRICKLYLFRGVMCCISKCNLDLIQNILHFLRENEQFMDQLVYLEYFIQKHYPTFKGTIAFPLLPIFLYLHE